MQSQEDDKYWQSEEYLKRNAAGAHSNSNVILSELADVKAELRELRGKLEKVDRYFWALGFGILLVMVLIWSRG